MHRLVMKVATGESVTVQGELDDLKVIGKQLINETPHYENGIIMKRSTVLEVFTRSGSPAGSKADTPRTKAA